MKCNEEFYKMFDYVQKSALDKEISKLSEKEKNAIINFPSKKTKTLENVIILLTKRLSKKDLKEKLGAGESECNDSLKVLSDLEIKTLFKEYYIDKREEKEELSNMEKKKNYSSISKLLKYLKKSRKYSHDNCFYKPFYEVLKEFSLEEIHNVMKCNTKEENELLYKKYGKDLLNIKFNEDLTNEESMIISSKILLNMRRRMIRVRNNESKIVSFFDFFENIDKETLLERFNRLNNTQKKKITKHFGEDLDRSCAISYKFLDGIISDEIREKLESNKEKTKRVVSIRSLTDVFSDYRTIVESRLDFKNRIKRIIDSFDENDKRLLYIKYGENLDKTKNSENYSTQEDFYIIHTLMAKIRWQLHKESRIPNNNKTLLERVDTNFKEDMLRNIEKLNSEDKEILKKKYGEDYSEEGKDLSKEENKKVKDVVTKVNRRIMSEVSDETNIDIRRLTIIKEYTKLPIYNEITNIYGNCVAIGLIIYLKNYDLLNDLEYFKLCRFSKNDMKNLLTCNTNGYEKGIENAILALRK